MVEKLKKSSVLKKKIGKQSKKMNSKGAQVLNLKTDMEIAMDFAVKVYKKFDKVVKAAVLFGSSVKQSSKPSSDIDIVLLIDDVSIAWDQELIAWYREELDKITRANPYEKSLHINTIKLSTWWGDLLVGDPVIMNILRYGEPLVDAGNFFGPLKLLLLQGKIKPTPETVYNCLQRAPAHLARSKAAKLAAIEGIYWAMVDSSQAALISASIVPPSPEHIPIELKNNFVDAGKLKIKYVVWYRDLLLIYKKISHGEIKEIKGEEIDLWQERTTEFIDVMARIVKDLINQE